MFEAREKSEWFEMDSPLGEPDLKWEKERWNEKYTAKEPNTYWIERTTKRNGEIVWFGQGVNWKKEKDGVWTILGNDENVKPTKTYYNPDGSISGYEYPENRTIWIPCEEPIYETLYKQLNEKVNG